MRCVAPMGHGAMRSELLRVTVLLDGDGLTAIVRANRLGREAACRDATGAGNWLHMTKSLTSYG